MEVQRCTLSVRAGVLTQLGCTSSGEAWGAAVHLSVRSAVLAGLGCALLVRRHSGQEGLQLFDELKQQRLEPNVITYIAVCSACRKGKQLDKALEFLEALELL